MAELEPRIPPLTPSEWTEEVRDLFAVMDGPEGRENGPSREIMHYLAQHPVLSARFMAFGRHILFDSILSDRVRELVTLYIAWTTKSDYEWVSHVTFGLHIGLTEADIEAVKQGPDSPHWSEFDSNLLRAVDQLRDSYNLDDELWASLSKTFDRREMMELVYTIGNYLLFSAVLNSFRIPLEPGTEDVVKKYGAP
jgi:4-carboxymuconolactone decarboxylase